MTAPVDVLAVLDCAAHCVTEHRGAVRGREVMQARAAISVLIGVAQSGRRNGDEQERRQWLAELDAALRAVGGALCNG